MNYFWVTTNPLIWKVDQIKDGKEEFFSAVNERGNKRRMWSAFEEVHEGDLVLFYESGSTKAIVAEGMITKGLHMADSGLGISLVHQREVGPISRDLLIASDKTKHLQPLRAGTSQGNLFRIKGIDFYNILNADTIENHIVVLQKNAIAILQKQIKSKNHKEKMEVAKEILSLLPPKPLYDYDRQYRSLYKNGYRTFFDIIAGALTGKVMARNGQIIIPIQIHSKNGYEQKDFEDDLRELIGKLKRIKESFQINHMEIRFKIGGTLKLPEWFKQMCEESGIKIVYIEDEEIDLSEYDVPDFIDDEPF